MVQEADLRLAEIKKATYEFDRDVLRGSVNPVSIIYEICRMSAIIHGAFLYVCDPFHSVHRG